MQFPVGDGKDLPRAKCDRLAIPRDDKCAGENESTDREEMSMPALAWSGLEVPRFDFSVTVGFELRFKFALVHWTLHFFAFSSVSVGSCFFWGGASEPTSVQFDGAQVAPKRGANECPRLTGGDQSEKVLVSSGAPRILGIT